MRISFVGKGGAGKSTLCALFAEYAVSKNRTVLAIDADINMHLARLVGAGNLSETSWMSHPESSEILKARLRGDNPRIRDNASFKKSTPPGSGSRLIWANDGEDPILARCATDIAGMRLMAVGTYGKEDVGASCYHNNLATFEIFLSHLADADAIVVADMVAGTDAFASTLHAQFDVTILAVEPTWRSVEVYNQYAALCEAAGCRSALKVMGNKIRTAEDVAFIRERIPAEMIIGFIGESPYLAGQDKNGGMIDIQRLEPENLEAFEVLFRHVTSLNSDPQSRLRKTHDIHRTYVAQASVRDRFGDLTDQIDADYDIAEAIRQRRV